MKIKKSILSLLIFIFMIGVIGCSNGSEISKEENLKQKKGEGMQSSQEVLKVATSPDFPPFEYIEIVDGKDKIVGFDAELIQEIGKELGKEVQMENMTFDGIVAAVQTGKVDMAISGMNPSPDREKKVNFSDPYYYASQTLLVKKDIKDIKNMEALKGKTIGSQIGSTSDQVISQFKGINVKKYNLVNDAILDLNNDRIDAVILEDSIASEFAKQNQELKVIVPEELKLDAEPFGIVISKEREQLLKDVNQALQQVIDSGKYDALVEKYGLANTLN
ncbi:basic amino acid ABC transporter substrate-binding protein [Garciella nitratireducens]|uniref:Polar amino acid transport system substrate-binding protein n=1 Tax=Garciella nitratireducens DSM 15102 TaxID=1121911 RepID=A0A1T4LM46_9FIRM|nr:basic amino acid ABC transporter substrate-binding protein [Garciella nitratireducens]SJZ55514.1 polar amino acid transport system substrate-binding protein [Garciella nitratireducens DSM 15102]